MNFDSLIAEFDKAIRTLFVAAPTIRPVPGQCAVELVMTRTDAARSCALMRINHVGEVCAQALYQGQAFTCHSPKIQLALKHAAFEETEHLAWTERRIVELGGRKSLLNPVWYAGALSLGVLAGKLGDSWSLGFLAETELQVVVHLNQHLHKLPEQDSKSRAIVEQMVVDEKSHADTAFCLGARELPASVKVFMRLVAGVMTRTAYYV